MKKILSAIASLFITTLILLSFASCNDLNLNFGFASGPSKNEGSDDHEHTYTRSWSTDDTHHWRMATCNENESCSTAKSRFEEHTFVDNICTTCYAARKHKHTYDDACDEFCNVCFDERIPDHVFDNDCDETCNECFYTRTTTHKPAGDDGNCTTPIYCSVCNEIVTEGSFGHAFTSECDTSCNTEACNCTRDVYHSYTNVCDELCNNCGYKRNAPHQYDNSNICNECGYGSKENPKDLKLPGELTFRYDPNTSADAVWYKFTAKDAVIIGVTLSENTVMSYGTDKDNMYIVDSDSNYTEFTLENNRTYYVNFITGDSSAADITAAVKCYNIYTKAEMPLYGKEILSFGDSIFGNNNTETGVCNQLQLASGATVYNCAFGGTRAYPRKENPGHINEPYRHFDMKNLIDAIITKNFAEQDAALRPDSDGNTFNNRFPAMLDRIKNVRFTDQIITINHGTNDWTGGTSIADYKETLKYIISRFRENYPNVRIVLISPTWRCTLENDVYVPGGNDTLKHSNGTNYDFAVAMGEVAEEMGIDFINCYDIGINATNAPDYFDGNDGTHHNAAGRELLAKYIAKELTKIIDQSVSN